MPLLDVRGLSVHFTTHRGPLWRREREIVRAVDDVSFSIEPGQTVGLVGESGCGKSTTARAILGLTRPTAGEIWFEGKRIDRLTRHAMRDVRRRLQMIFQDPFGSLNPRMTIGQIVAEPMEIFELGDSRRRKLETLRLLDLVGLNATHMNRYPHEFSGGQRQRIGIARALSVRPRLVVCDEPVSALDVSIQAQVVNLLGDLKKQFGLSYLFIAHDLAVVRHMADVVAVMSRGKIVEIGPAEAVYNRPQHPYTRALLSAVLVPDPRAARERAAARATSAAAPA